MVHLSGLRPSLPQIFSSLAILLCTWGTSITLRAQSTDVLYREMLEPRAIAKLDSISLAPIVAKTGFNLNYYPDNSMPGWDELFAAYGPGVFSFMWMAPNGLQDRDTSHDFIFKRDDEIICQGTPNVLFHEQACDITSSALSYRTSGARRIDLQVPFTSMFRISQRIKPTTDYIATFWSVYFRMLPPSVIPSFTSTTAQPMASTLAKVEGVMKAMEPPMPADGLDTVETDVVITSNTTATIFRSDTLGTIIRCMLDIDRRDTTTLDSLRFRCTWNNDFHPAIDVPLADVFNAGSGVRADSSWFVTAPPTGWFALKMPMPFTYGARIDVAAQTVDTVRIRCRVIRQRGIVDDAAGHLHMTYFETPRAAQTKPLYVASIRGTGKIVGTHYATRKHQYGPSWLEGDVFFYAEGRTTPKIAYWGIEDYYSGGWFFTNGAFNTLFAGCPKLYSPLYRYHVLDPIAFDSSMTVEFGHGTRFDFPSAPRITTIYYLRHGTFDVATDTVRAGAPLRIRVHTTPGTPSYRIAMDSTAIGIIDADGRSLIDTAFTIPPAMQGGDHRLTVNNVAWRSPITVLRQPVIRRTDADPNKPLLAYATFPVNVAGCMPGESIDIVVAGGTVVARGTASADGKASLLCKVPNLSVGSYSIVARTTSATASSADRLSVTRTFTFECEDLDVVDSAQYTSIFYTGFRTEPFWSDGRYRLIDPPTQSGIMTMILPIRYPGTYTFDLWGAEGKDMGTYQIMLDDKVLGVRDYFRDTTSGIYVRTVAQHVDELTLSRGVHTLRVICVGRNARAERQLFVADDLELTPVGSSVGVPEDPDATHILVSPLPAHPGDRITLHSVDAPLHVHIIDGEGKSMQPTWAPGAGGTLVDVPSDMATGVYAVRCTFNDGTSATARMMIVR